MKAIIFNTEIEAKNWDYANNSLTGSITKYRYARKPLKATTTLTKAKYAELYSIPAKILDENDVESTNPAYTELKSSYTVQKYGVVVEDSKDVTDEDGNVTVPDNVVDITDLLPVASDEI